MDQKKANYQIIQSTANVPYNIIVHTQQKLEDNKQQDADGNFVVPKLLNHWHEAMEINYLFSGTWFYIVNGREYTITGDQFILINPEAIHNIRYTLDPDSPETLGFTVLIHEDFLKYLVPDIQDIYFDAPAVADEEPIRRLLLRIYQSYCSDTQEEARLAIIACITMLLYELDKGGAKKNKSVIPINSQKGVERLRGIMTYLEQNYAQPILMKDIATKFYFSRSYFTRFFRQYTGMTFNEYLTRLRLEKALDLMHGTELNMTEIAMRCGFSDSRRFIISFRKYYGITPYQYKLAHKGAIR